VTGERRAGARRGRNGDEDEDGLSNFEQALILGLGAVAVGLVAQQRAGGRVELG
jgi:hypothetical protein